MHIVLVNRWYPPHTGFGGVAVYNYYLAHALAKRGHQVAVIAARWSPDVPAIEDDGGVTVHRLLAQYPHWPQRVPVAGRYVRSFRQLRYSMLVACKLHQLERAGPPDVVEFAEVEGEGFAYLRAQRRRPVVVRCHTPSYLLRRYYLPHETPYDTSLTEAIEKFTIRRADALSAPSHDMAQMIAATCSVPAERIRVIPNALDVDYFAPRPARAAINGGSSALGSEQVADRARTDHASASDITILHVGRLDRGKGIEVLAQAIPLVLRDAPRARFVFAGDDRPDNRGSTWRKRLETICATSGAHDRVLFLGSVSQESLREWYSRADIAVVPSLIYESFSYTCAQAMASGLPLVASAIGGIPETTGNGDCAVLAPPGDAQRLADGLIRLSRDAELRRRMGMAARRRAADLFAADTVAGQTSDLYRSLVAHSSALPIVNHRQESHF